MPRLRNTATGVVVTVSDEMAKKLGGYEPVSEPKKAPAKKADSTK